MIHMQVDHHMFTVTNAELTADGVKPRRLSYEWVSGEPGARNWRGVDVVEHRDGWHAQVAVGFTQSPSSFHGPCITPAQAVQIACSHHDLAWPPEAGKP